MNKRTKIVCTIGPASSSPAVVAKLLKAGMNVARFNFSHGSYESNLELLENVRKGADKAGLPVAILQDLQGPRIRVGQLPKEGLELIEGSMMTVVAGALTSEPGTIPVPYDRLAAELKKGDRILLEDGLKELEVIDIRGKKIRTKVLLGGRLLSNKGINLPTATLSIDAVTEKDERDLAFGLKQNIDFVALSFVRSADDVRLLRQKIKRHLPAGVQAPAVIVKIEKHEALLNFDAILAETDGVMVARGDLGLETPISRLPLRQKEIIAKCLLAAKPVITATEMLSSMQHNPRPTRAEVSDVANAVIDHTDATMLSGESAMGKYPTEAVSMMAQTAYDTEESSLTELTIAEAAGSADLSMAVGSSAVKLAQNISAAAILVTTQSGYSARSVSRFRPSMPIIAATDNPRTYQQLLLSWGVTPMLIEGYEEPEKMANTALKQLKTHLKPKKGSKIVLVSGLKRDKDTYDSVIRVVEI